MTFKVQKAHSPQWASPEKNAVNLTVTFEHEPKTEFLFTAVAEDSTAHGQEPFHNAIAGEYGEIAPLSQEWISAVTLAENSLKRRKQMELCLSKVQHWDMFGETEKAQAWKDYFKALAQLKGSKEWPIVKEWPERPESEQEVE